jgi:hypothetical protein
MVINELKDRINVQAFRNFWNVVFGKNFDLSVVVGKVVWMDKEIVKAGDEVLVSFPRALKLVYWAREDYEFPDVALSTTKADILSIAFSPVLFNILKTFPTDAASTDNVEKYKGHKDKIGDCKALIHEFDCYTDKHNSTMLARLFETIVQLETRLQAYKAAAIKLVYDKVEAGFSAAMELRSDEALTQFLTGARGGTVTLELLAGLIPENFFAEKGNYVRGPLVLRDPTFRIKIFSDSPSILYSEPPLIYIYNSR